MTNDEFRNDELRSAAAWILGIVEIVPSGDRVIVPLEGGLINAEDAEGTEEDRGELCSPGQARSPVPTKTSPGVSGSLDFSLGSGRPRRRVSISSTQGSVGLGASVLKVVCLR